jgi:hypothetical protein
MSSKTPPGVQIKSWNPPWSPAGVLQEFCRSLHGYYYDINYKFSIVHINSTWTPGGVLMDFTDS